MKQLYHRSDETRKTSLASMLPVLFRFVRDAESKKKEKLEQTLGGLDRSAQLVFGLAIGSERICTRMER